MWVLYGGFYYLYSSAIPLRKFDLSDIMKFCEDIRHHTINFRHAKSRSKC